MPDIIATVGAANANSYVTRDEADAVIDARGFTSAWSDAAYLDVDRAIIWATTVLDAEQWKGARVDSTQALKWPRTYVYTPEGALLSSTEIPAFLKRATAELALALLGSDRTADAETAGLAQIKVGEIFLTMNPHDRSAMYPPFVRKLISPYLTSGSSQSGVQLQRV